MFIRSNITRLTDVGSFQGIFKSDEGELYYSDYQRGRGRRYQFHIDSRLNTFLHKGWGGGSMVPNI